MVQKHLGLVALMAACLLLIGTAMAVPVAIDGNLNDWGLGQLVSGGDWAINETWVPNSDVNYIVEDNQDKYLGGTGFKGVHIYGKGSAFSYYYEHKIKRVSGVWVIEPDGGEPFDLEAVYMTQNPSTLFLAIVTSVDPSLKGGSRPGDLALNVDDDSSTGENGYEYGIVMGENPYLGSGLTQGDIVYLPDWESKGAIDPQERPDVIVGGTVVGNLGDNLVYDNSWMTVSDHGVPNYVIEAAIPKSQIGATGKNLKISNLFYADNCLNDTLYVPEFPTIAISIGAILGVMFLAINLRNKN